VPGRAGSLGAYPPPPGGWTLTPLVGHGSLTTSPPPPDNPTGGGRRLPGGTPSVGQDPLTGGGEHLPGGGGRQPLPSREGTGLENTGVGRCSVGNPGQLCHWTHIPKTDFDHWRDCQDRVSFIVAFLFPASSPPTLETGGGSGKSQIRLPPTPKEHRPSKKSKSFVCLKGVTPPHTSTPVRL